MATFNKPGVYIQEVLTSNPQVNNISGTSVGAFIGIADRGPTATVGGTLVGVPTLVSSWDEFVKTFSFDAVTSPFSTEVFGSTVSNTSNFLGTATQDLKYAMYAFFSNGGSNAYVTRKINSDAKASSITVGDNQGTVGVTASSNTLTYAASTTAITVTAATATAWTGITPSTVVSFSGVTVGPATLATGITSTSSITASGSTTITAVGTITTANAVGAVISGTGFATNTIITGVAGQVVTFTPATTASTPAGSTLTISANPLNAALASTNSLIVTATTDTVLTLAYAGGAVSGGATQTAGTVTVTGINSTNTSAALVISANSPGTWGNNIWVGITPNQTPNYFDLTVYYGVDATVTASSATYTSLKSSNIVETIPQLSLNASDARYAPNVVNSNWITVSVNAGTPTNPTTRVPAFTSVWATNTDNVTASNNTFKWSSNGIVTDATTLLPPAVRLGGYTTITFTAASSSAAPIATSAAGTAFASTSVRLTSTTGVAGNTAVDVEFTAQQLDAVPNQLVINYPGVYDQTNLQKLLTYASNRSDSFVVIDPGSAATTAATITTYFDNMPLLTNQKFGAVYFPNLQYIDPSPTAQVGKTITMPPGGAVVGEICSTDSNRGAFKSPAGVNSVIPGAIPVSSLSNSDFDKINSALKNINVIRNVAGYGTCIMGARTLSSPYSDKYISVRRTLNYLEFTLKNSTQFAVFEPNDQNLWAEVTSVVSGLLSDYWSKGGLAGATAYQAFYVKCDSTINTSATIAAGQVNIEVGVALQRPAEFVVIKIGQINGGTTITTTL